MLPFRDYFYWYTDGHVTVILGQFHGPSMFADRRIGVSALHSNKLLSFEEASSYWTGVFSAFHQSIQFSPAHSFIGHQSIWPNYRIGPD